MDKNRKQNESKREYFRPFLTQSRGDGEPRRAPASSQIPRPRAPSRRKANVISRLFPPPPSASPNPISLAGSSRLIASRQAGELRRAPGDSGKAAGRDVPSAAAEAEAGERVGAAGWRRVVGPPGGRRLRAAEWRLLAPGGRSPRSDKNRRGLRPVTSPVYRLAVRGRKVVTVNRHHAAG